MPDVQPMNALAPSSSDAHPKLVVICIHALPPSNSSGHALSSASLLNRHWSANFIKSTANILPVKRLSCTSTLPASKLFNRREQHFRRLIRRRPLVI
jgi:hypothetical protein